VLTDGEIYDTDPVFHLASTVSLTTPTRIFTLGVGNAVSHHLVNGLARAGRGTAEFVGYGERMEAKVVRMVKAGVRGFVEDLKVTWLPQAVVDKVQHDQSSTPTPPPPYSAAAAPSTEPHHPAPSSSSSFFDEDVTPDSDDPLHTLAPPAPPPALVQQAPFFAPPIYAGARYVCFAIIDPRLPDPTAIVITGHSVDGPMRVEVPVGDNAVVVGETGEGGTEEVAVLHTMAARTLVQDIEEGKSWMHRGQGEGAGGDVDEAVSRAEVVRLSKKYGIVSKYTSYVAVQIVDGRERATGMPQRIVVPSRREAQLVDQTSVSAIQAIMHANIHSVVSRGDKLDAIEMRTDQLQAQSRQFAKSTKKSAGPSSFRVPPPSYGAPAQSYGSQTSQALDDALPMSPPLERNYRVASTLSDGAIPTRRAPPHYTPQQILAILVSLQNFDGSFPSDNRLFGISLAITATPPAGRTPEEWATAVAIALMQVRLAAQKDEWELMADKAVAWLDGRVGEKERKRLVAKTARVVMGSPW
ncbi:von Willebrand factor A domain-containing protein 5A, partial [Gonapodya sp. JEL0774]